MVVIHLSRCAWSSGELRDVVRRPRLLRMEQGAINDVRLCTGACVITDAERYTSVAEAIDPAGVFDFVNRYLEVLFRPVYRNAGFVADVRGDGMLAVWTAACPDTELRSRVCRACLDIAGSAADFASGGLQTRIGAHFGPIALGTVGTSAHYEYRAVGDTVNTSSRLEQLNKELGTRVLVSRELAAGLDDFLFRDLGEVRLRGKRNEVRVLELMGEREAATPRQVRLATEFSAVVAAEQSGRWREALERLRDLQASYPRDRPTHLHVKRCEQALLDRGGFAALADEGWSWGMGAGLRAASI